MPGLSGVSTRTVPPSNVTWHPRRRSTADMIRMSVIRGTLEITDSPVASSAAAINFSAEFFAPPTVTSPDSRAPPTTRITSTRAIVGAGTQAGAVPVGRRSPYARHHGRAPHPHLHEDRRHRDDRAR